MIMCMIAYQFIFERMGITDFITSACMVWYQFVFERVCITDFIHPLCMVEYQFIFEKKGTPGCIPSAIAVVYNAEFFLPKPHPWGITAHPDSNWIIITTSDLNTVLPEAIKIQFMLIYQSDGTTNQSLCVNIYADDTVFLQHCQHWMMEFDEIMLCTGINGLDVCCLWKWIMGYCKKDATPVL